MGDNMTLQDVPLIQVLTRQPTIFGLSYNYFALMVVVCLPAIFITDSYMIFSGLGTVLYLLGRWLAAHDPQWLDGFFLQQRNCRPQKNRNYWGCRSYAPW
jgi:type IV secretory pathway VirB3-like protein